MRGDVSRALAMMGIILIPIIILALLVVMAGSQPSGTCTVQEVIREEGRTFIVPVERPCK